MVGHELGVLLVQLPPSLKFDLKVAESFFRLVREQAESPIVCEPRHATWFEPEADGLMNRYQIGRVAADPDLKVIRAYDSTLIRVGSLGISDRISYVISPEGKIVYAYSDRNPDKHVANTLAAVKALKK